MAPASNNIRRTYTIRDTNDIPTTNDSMLFLVQPIHQFHTVNLTNGQGITQPLHINGAGIVQQASLSQNGAGGSQPLQSNGDGILQDVSPRPRGRRFALTFDHVAQKFHMPIDKAAKEFGLSVTTLKWRCRELGFKKWPYPKLQCLQNLVKNLMEFRIRGFQNLVDDIMEEINSIKQNPSLEIKHEITKLKKKMYDLKTRKRRRIDVSAA
ncbi:RWP-RK domain-containing protein [Rhynchospora pubera]|uniref:RWP-RK domain-containing protein n=1 Tax=Rhynchospora pubera TaxID=906938 RepID=A0AAV8D4C5_9POAL|nr:RWP-RK domain-containing protein [Rhynchospora pubera]